MKYIKKQALYYFLFLGIAHISLSAPHSALKETQQKSVQPVQARYSIPQRQASHTQHAPLPNNKNTQKKSPPSNKTLKLEPHLDEKLIQKLTKTVASIPEKYEKSQSNSSSEKKEAQTENKQYRQKVEEAYEAYKELYDQAIYHKKYTTPTENEEIRKAAQKLFECKNIRDMPWKRKP